MGMLTRLASGTRSTALAAQGDRSLASSGVREPAVGTTSITYSSPSWPQEPRWNAEQALQVGYYAHLYTYRCVRHIAQTIGGLAFRAGDSPDNPGQFSPNAPMAKLLGPAPGGPAPSISARQWWIWSIVQYLVTGRFASETELAGGSTGVGGQRRVKGLWPLPVTWLKPFVSQKPGEWFSGFRYSPQGKIIDLRPDQVFYAWRPSQDDWREPESALQSMSLPVSVAVAMDRFMIAFARNNMVGSKMVITPAFAEDDERRGFQEQFLSQLTGYDNAGRTAFAEWEDDADSLASGKTPSVQVVDLGTKPVDVQLLDTLKYVRDVILDGWGVPLSIIGQSAERTFSNADQEHRNYWTGTILNLVHELEDHVNIGLAPRLGSEVGWFDLTKVEALRPARVFAPDTPSDLVKAGIVDADEVRVDLGLQARDPNTVVNTPEPAVDDTPGAAGGSSSGSGTRLAATDVDMPQWAIELRAQVDALAAGTRVTAGTAEHPEATERLMEYWAHGEGAAKIQWGVPHDFNRCVVELGKYVKPEQVKGLCANLHHRALGVWPGQEDPGGRGGKRDGLTETSSAGAMLPVAPIPHPPAARPGTHVFVPGTPRTVCATCGRGVTAAVHQLGTPGRRRRHAGMRHAGPGHAPVRGGHVKTVEDLRTATSRTVDSDARSLEPTLADAMRGLFAAQRKATVDRLKGRRGTAMVRAAQPSQTPEGPPEEPVDLTPVDVAAVFDSTHWATQTAQQLGPTLGAVRSLTARRLTRDLRLTDGEQITGAQAIAAALEARAEQLGRTITDTTAAQILETLTEGVHAGEGMSALAARVNHVFDVADSARAETIARTTVIGAMNEASQALATAMPQGVVAGKEWLSAHDARVREHHREADGQTRALSMPFEVGGFPAMFPGDPALPPGECINCRCTALHIPVRAALPAASSVSEAA